MATHGAAEAQPPLSMLTTTTTTTTAVHGGVRAKCDFNMDNLSKPELLTLLSIMEGELEARDLVIETLRARRKEVFIQERYGCFSLTDPFLALQRDHDARAAPGERQAVCVSPTAVLETLTAHCRRMQERMGAQLAEAEGREKKLQQEKQQLQALEQEQRKLSAQLKEEREKNKLVVMMLVREYRHLVARAAEEAQRHDDTSSRLQEELAAERLKVRQMEARMEEQLSEMDTERGRLQARLAREEARSAQLRAESEALSQQLKELGVGRDPAVPAEAKACTSVAVGTDAVSCQAVSCQTDPLPADPGTLGSRTAPLGVAAKPPASGYAGMSLPKSHGVQRPLQGVAAGLPQAENGSCGSDGNPGFSGAAAGLPTGVSPRVQAARYKFQASPTEQDQNGSVAPSPPSRDLSPTSRDSLAAKQQARQTVTQVLSRFTSPPTAGALRPGLSHSTSELGSFPGRLSHPQISLKSPTVARIDRGTPPPIPPKKPGLSQTPSPPQPSVKVVPEGTRSPGSGVGPPPKPTSAQLPPKPALDLGGTGPGCPLPGLTTSQVGASPPQPRGLHQGACSECPPVSTATVGSSSLNPVSASSCRPRDPERPLAAASGWRTSVAPSPVSGDPIPLANGLTLLLQAATQGNVTLLSMLLNQDPNNEDGKSALYSAAQNGHADCVNLLLKSGIPPDVPDKNGFAPLHVAAANGHSRCVEELVQNADVNRAAAGGQTPLFLACSSGNLECVKVLLDAGADCTAVTSDSWTMLHAAVTSGHVDVLRLLMYHTDPGVTPPSALLNHSDRDGWTAAHIAASKGFKDCLEVLCTNSEQDIEKRDKWSRTIHDVATDDCKELLENLSESGDGARGSGCWVSWCQRVRVLGSYKVLVKIHQGWEEQLCLPEDMDSGPVVGVLSVNRHTGWAEFSSSIAQTLTAHLRVLCGSWDHVEEDSGAETALGLGVNSIASVLVGEAVWFPGQELPQSPWDLVRKPHSQHATIQWKGLTESSLDEMSYESLIPVQLLHNYVRLVEQYRNVIFHGSEGSCQDFMAHLVAYCVKHKQEAAGASCSLVKVHVDEKLSKEQLLEVFVTCGFLVPSGEPGSDHCVLVLLEGLEQASSLWELLGDLCEGLENRGQPYPLGLLHALDGSGPYHFLEGGFLIGTLSKTCLHGPELLLQQHFRWVQLRWDSEPLAGLLDRHLRRKLLHKLRGQVPEPSDPSWKSVAWICSVWHQLNACLARLGTPQALLGPHMFFSCPVVPEQTPAVIRWLSRLWNMVIVPRVEEAIISRVTTTRSPQRQLPRSPKLSPGQQAVVKAALSILVNKAVLQSCPLPRTEMEKYVSAFLGGDAFSLLAHGSFGGRTKRDQDSPAWRKVRTGPRRRGGSWKSGTMLRDGAVCSPDIRLSRMNRCTDGSVLLCMGSDDESDLMQELWSLCSSRSEPDIRKISHSREDFIVFPVGQTQKEKTVQAQIQRAGRCHSDRQPPKPTSSENHTARPKSQLPIPGSRNQQCAHGLPRASSRTRQILFSNSNRRSNEEIWILHEKNNNK